jgi:hypothetical protein
MVVLIIEPDIVQARAYQAAFAARGHKVLHALSAQTAVHAADSEKPDVVVLELQLPRHNGVEFLYEFRSYAEWRDIPVIVHTFVPLAELESQPTLKRELGVKTVLYKPGTPLERLCAATESAAAMVQK